MAGNKDRTAAMAFADANADADADAERRAPPEAPGSDNATCVDSLKIWSLLPNSTATATAFAFAFAPREWLREPIK